MVAAYLRSRRPECRLVKAKGQKVAALRRYLRTSAKSDRIDALTLAKMPFIDPERLDELYLAPERYAERLEWHRERIPYKLHRARYHSFYRYFHYLQQLGFVEPTDREETSYIQENYPDAPPRNYYLLSRKGIEAPDCEWFRPQLTLYPELTPQYFSEKNRERRQKATTKS